jgi:hypothetical protein
MKILKLVAAATRLVLAAAGSTMNRADAALLLRDCASREQVSIAGWN